MLMKFRKDFGFVFRNFHGNLHDFLAFDGGGESGQTSTVSEQTPSNMDWLLFLTTAAVLGGAYIFIERLTLAGIFVIYFILAELINYRETSKENTPRTTPISKSKPARHASTFSRPVERVLTSSGKPPTAAPVTTSSSSARPNNLASEEPSRKKKRKQTISHGNNKRKIRFPSHLTLARELSDSVNGADADFKEDATSILRDDTNLKMKAICAPKDDGDCMNTATPGLAEDIQFTKKSTPNGICAIEEVENVPADDRLHICDDQLQVDVKSNTYDQQNTECKLVKGTPIHNGTAELLTGEIGHECSGGAYSRSKQTHPRRTQPAASNTAYQRTKVTRAENTESEILKSEQTPASSISRASNNSGFERFTTYLGFSSPKIQTRKEENACNSSQHSHKDINENDDYSEDSVYERDGSRNRDSGNNYWDNSNSNLKFGNSKLNRKVQPCLNFEISVKTMRDQCMGNRSEEHTNLESTEKEQPQASNETYPQYIKGQRRSERNSGGTAFDLTLGNKMHTSNPCSIISSNAEEREDFTCCRETCPETRHLVRRTLDIDQECNGSMNRNGHATNMANGDADAGEAADVSGKHNNVAVKGSETHAAKPFGTEDNRRLLRGIATIPWICVAENMQAKTFGSTVEGSKQMMAATYSTDDTGGIDALIRQAESAEESGDREAARRGILQALVGANNVKDRLVQHGDPTVSQDSLAEWFGTCAVILNKIGDYVQAARCFYTATIFDINWTDVAHRRVSITLWNSMVFSQPRDVLRERFQKLRSFLEEVDGLGVLAEMRARWHVCIVVTSDVQKIFEFLQRRHQLEPRDPALTFAGLKRTARCALRLGKHEEVRKLCILALQEFTDYNDPEAFEIWARSLFTTKEYPVARTKCEMAIKCSKNDAERARLEKFNEEIKEHVITSEDSAILGFKLMDTVEEMNGESVEEIAVANHHEDDDNHTKVETLKRLLSIGEHGEQPSVLTTASDTPTSASTTNSASASQNSVPKLSKQARRKRNKSKRRLANQNDVTNDTTVMDPNIKQLKEVNSARNGRNLANSKDVTILYEREPNQATTAVDPTIKHLKEFNSARHRSRSSSMCSYTTTTTDPSLGTDSSLNSDWTDSDDDDDDDDTAGDIWYGPCKPSDVDVKETSNALAALHLDDSSFYEQSRNIYNGYSDSNDGARTVLDDMQHLKSGLQFSENFRDRYQDRRMQRNPFYNAPLGPEELKERMLKNKDKFKRCVLHIEGSHLSNCIPIDTSDKITCVEISGRSKAGQYFNEDEVVVELLDAEHEKKDKRYGRVIGRLNRQRFKDIDHPVMICTLDDMESHLVRPLCKTVPKIHILNKEIKSKCENLKRYKVEIYDFDESKGELCNPRIVDVNPGDRERYVYLVVLIKWSPMHVYPMGAVISRLACGETADSGLRILNLQHEVPTFYSQQTVRSIESILLRHGDEPDASAFEGRVDLTDLDTFTIDPADSRDLDDALSIEEIEDGFRVGVHIADVVAYVPKGSPVDTEAYQRATTFYPGFHRPRNMIPEPLSNGICSLLPGKRRLTLSVVFSIGENGRLIQTADRNPQMMKSVIRSRQQFSYKDAQDVIENKQGKADAFATDIKRLFRLAHKMRKRRLGNAMFALDLDQEEGTSEESTNDSPEAHYMIEEFMVLTNEKVAERLKRAPLFRDCIPLRCQPSPDKESMEKFVKDNDLFIDTLVSLQDRQISDYKKPSFDNLLQEESRQKVVIASSIWAIIKNASAESVKCVRTDKMHPLQYLVYQHWLAVQEVAVYRCSGSVAGKDDGGHYSLGYFPYVHFTSPIRRYSDLIVHSLLTALLEGRTCPYKKQEVEEVCMHITSISKRAKAYQKGCKALQQAIEYKNNARMIRCFVDEVSDRGVSLCSPSFRNVAKIYRELAFNLLDMGSKPAVVTDTETARDIVTATWRKRLYNVHAPASIPNESSSAHRALELNPNPGVVFIPLHHWARILKCAIDGRMEDLKRAIHAVSLPKSGSGLADVTTECRNIMKIQPNTKFTLKFTHGQTLNVQMSAELQKGILAPRPVLYNMTQNVKLCLQHTDDPVLHLSRYTTTPTSDIYTNVGNYLKRWIPLISMESATGAVKNEESCVINNVLIKFGRDECGKFELPLGFCELRNIELSGTLDEDETVDTDDEKSYDWLCIKRIISKPKQTSSHDIQDVLAQDHVWVGHAAVTKVRKVKDQRMKGGGTIKVTFRLHERCQAVPPELLQGRMAFDVEIISKSEVDRRTESYVKTLCPGSLAVVIALNNSPIPSLDQDHAAIARHIERDLYIERSDDVHPLPRNNKKQQEAIDKALMNRFTLIQGPPGTGKSYTGIKLICLFNRINGMLAKEGKMKKQVMFCGPSNKSVDVVAKWMITRLGDKLCPKVVRVYGRSIEAIDFPIPGRTFLSKKSTRNQKADDELKKIALHHLIRENGTPKAEDIKEFDRIFKETDYAPQPEKVKQYVHLLSEASIEEIRKYDVILCTAAVGSNPKVLKATNVHQVIVDEAGMCPEPQCLVPIIATKAEQVVLIGDHKQLRPIIMCKEAAELGMDKSLFERYATTEMKNNVQFTMLDTQYRMNPQLCMFPSQKFYDGKLKTYISRPPHPPNLWNQGLLLDIWPRKEGRVYPHVLVHVEGEEKVLTVSTDEGNEQSKSNAAEVEYVVKLYRYLIEQSGADTSQINVMSQYNAQCTELKKALENEKMTECRVNTVVSSQGGEWDYVIFSTVRSLPDYKIEKSPTLGWCKQNLGFITDRNQINVALTRAKKGIIIVGNKHLLRCDEVWADLLGGYERCGCVKTPEEFPPRRKTRLEIMEERQLRNEQLYGESRFIPGQATSYEGSFDEEPKRRHFMRHN